MEPENKNLINTYSIVAYDPESEQLGAAAQSKFFAVGANVLWVDPDAGAIATQALTNAHHGRDGLEMLPGSTSTESVLESLLKGDEGRQKRQIGMVSSTGDNAGFTGEECPEHSGQVLGDYYSCQGNLLASEKVVDSMATTYESDDSSFNRRLLNALKAAQREGGDRRGQQSAALVVVKKDCEDISGMECRTDLRVDDSFNPLSELERLLDLYTLYFEDPEEGKLVKLSQDLTIKLQKLLTKLGYYGGNTAGKLSGDFESALRDFLWTENLRGRYTKAGSNAAIPKIDSRVISYMESVVEGSNSKQGGRRT